MSNTTMPTDKLTTLEDFNAAIDASTAKIFEEVIEEATKMVDEAFPTPIPIKKKTRRNQSAIEALNKVH